MAWPYRRFKQRLQATRKWPFASPVVVVLRFLLNLQGFL